MNSSKNFDSRVPSLNNHNMSLSLWNFNLFSDVTVHILGHTARAEQGLLLLPWPPSPWPQAPVTPWPSPPPCASPVTRSARPQFPSRCVVRIKCLRAWLHLCARISGCWLGLNSRGVASGTSRLCSPCRASASTESFSSISGAPTVSQGLF